MHLFFAFSFAFFFAFTSEAVDLTCPNSPVTGDGKFPSEGLTKFPAGYYCSVDFQIPKGKVVKFVTQADANADGDQISIRDAVSTVYGMGEPQSLMYAAGDKANLLIITKTSNASFFVMWQYIDVTGYTKIQKPTGTILPLNFTQGSYYQFTSSKNRVALHTATLDRIFDMSLSRVYVYDGEDLSSNFLGTLLHFLNTKNMSSSTGKSLTLVNFYGIPTLSYAIVNDYSAVSHYDRYSFFVLASSSAEFLGGVVVPDMLESAITMYCIDCQELYITDLILLDQRNGLQTVHFKPLSPTHVDNNLLIYKLGDPLPKSFPQQILTNTFTMIMYQCDLHYSIATGPLYTWSLGYSGRNGYIISPSAWNPTTALTTPFSTNITTTDTVKFVFDLQSVVVDKPGDKIRIEVGSSGVKPVFVEFNTTAMNTGTKAAYGTYMTTSFTGTTVGASFIMNFNVEDIASTTVPVETTTKSSNVWYILPVFIIFAVFEIVYCLSDVKF
ncbi:unnamed protein product [Caenorhabditis nigoni]